MTVCVQRMHIIPKCFGTHVNNEKSGLVEECNFLTQLLQLAEAAPPLVHNLSYRIL